MTKQKIYEHLKDLKYYIQVKSYIKAIVTASAIIEELYDDLVHEDNTCPECLGELHYVPCREHFDEYGRLEEVEYKLVCMECGKEYDD